MYDERIVVNASPLILLAKIDAVPLLEETSAEIVVPQAVRAEVEEGPLGPGDVSGLFTRESLRVVADLQIPREIVE